MLTLLVAAAFAQQPSECPFGVNGHQNDDASLALAADAGIGWVRMDFNWYQMEPSPGVYDWSAADRFIDTATAEGLNVFPTIAYAPAWAVAPGCNDLSPEPGDWCHNQSPDPAAWASFVEAAVARYGDRVKVWGLWNEPNLEHFYRDTREVWVRDVLVPGAEALHTTCSDCQVAGPELANIRGANWDSDEGVCAFGECMFNGWEVSLTEILDEAGDHIDIVTHHRYDDSAQIWLDELIGGQWFGNLQYMHGLKEITDAHAPGKPVWITEFGWETTPGGPYSPSYAADQLTDSYLDLQEARTTGWNGHAPWPELDKLFWYDLHDDPVVHAWGQYTWGLLDADGQPKEAYYAYADVIDALGGCEAFVSGGTPPGAVDTGTVDTGSGAVDTGLDGSTGDTDTDTDTDSGPGTGDTQPPTGMTAMTGVPTGATATPTGDTATPTSGTGASSTATTGDSAPPAPTTGGTGTP